MVVSFLWVGSMGVGSVCAMNGYASIVYDEVHPASLHTM